MTDHRDLALEALAVDEAALRARFVECEQDRKTWRAIAQQAIEELHAVLVDRDRLRAAHRRLVDEFRFVRGDAMRQAVAA